MAECRPFLTGPYWADTTFACTLPRRQLAPPLPSGAPGAEAFTAYLTAGLFFERRLQDPDCRNSWAFALTGAVLHATRLGYRALGAVFDNRHLSLEFLVSCYSSRDKLCGCYGADLCTALEALAFGGLVTYRQAPYVASSRDQSPNSRVDVNYYCGASTWLDTCPPCAPSMADYVENVVPAGAPAGGARFEVPCIPCSQPRAPRYYAHAPFVLGGDGWTRAEQVAATKAELRRIGPLAAALPIDDAALLALQQAAPLVVRRCEDGLRYEPRDVRDGVFHSVLIVGYLDAAPDTAVWICRASWAAPFGYALAAPAGLDADEVALLGTATDVLLNVRMYEGPGAALVERVVSFEAVRVRTDPDEPPHALALTDPLLVLGRPVGAAPAPRSPLLGLGALLVLLLLLVLALAWP